jgi:hypothetical protein
MENLKTKSLKNKTKTLVYKNFVLKSEHKWWEESINVIFSVRIMKLLWRKNKQTQRWIQLHNEQIFSL